MISKIVVGTDGSETAQVAVDLAIELARQSGATLHLLHAVKASPSGAPVSQVGRSVIVRGDQAMSREVQDAADAVLISAAEGTEGVTIQTHTVTGAPVGALIDVATQIGADLIVVGSKGMHGAHRLIGSVANSVAHGAPCHVVIAKSD